MGARPAAICFRETGSAEIAFAPVAWVNVPEIADWRCALARPRPKARCASFCCRLIVRLAPAERDPRRPDDAAKHCIDKDPEDGLCTYLDRDTGRCAIWADRPALCRAYDCNQDPLRQVVLRDGFTSLIELVTSRPPPEQSWKQVPYAGATPTIAADLGATPPRRGAAAAEQ